MANFPSCSHHAIGKEVRPPKNFSSVGIHRSRFKFKALGLVLIIFPSSELRIAHHFFNRLLISQGTFFQNFKFFLNRFPKYQFRQNSLKHVRIRSTWAWFDHISLIQPRNSIPFFYGLLILQGTFCQNFKIFLNRLNRLESGSTGSSSQLVWSTNFGDFGAQFLHSLGPWALDQFWAVFWIHFAPYFGFLAAHHESILILGGKPS